MNDGHLSIARVTLNYPADKTGILVAWVTIISVPLAPNAYLTTGGVAVGVALPLACL